MASSISLPSFAAKTSNILNPDGTSIDQSFAPTNGGMFRNRIINGDMRIDQRNSGAEITYTAQESKYLLDRFIVGLFGTTYSGNVLSVQQVSDAPEGFTNSLKVTAKQNVSFDTNKLGSFITHKVEGFNVSDLDLGLSTAKPITVGLWLKSNKTGTVSVNMENSASDRSYGTTLAITAANTWQFKTVTIPGDVVGTWLKTNGTGLSLSIGVANNGSWLTAASGVWSANRAIFNSAQTNFLSTTNDFLAVTGVQLEKGSSATPFEFRPYGLELSLCHRYFASIGRMDIVTIGGRLLSQGHGTLMRATPILTVAETRLLGAGTLLTSPTWVIHSLNGRGYSGEISYTSTDQYSLYDTRFAAEL